MKVCTIIGARPQFIKVAAVSRAIAAHNRLTLNLEPGTLNFEYRNLNEVIVHTGQHYDDEMSAIFFRELEIPNPAYNLGIGSGGHGAQTGQMLAGIEDVLLKEKPDWVIIYGDTNSTLAGALAAAKLHLPIAHVEAGLRSFNRLMPEEINRVVADHLSALLFCPSQVAVNNLHAEGISNGVSIVGDVMADAFQFAAAKFSKKMDIMYRLNIEEKRYYLATIHRAENTNDSERLYSIMSAFSKIAEKNSVVLPLHPRTRKILGDKISTFNQALKIIDPVGYFDIVALQKSALMILTDSGGMQKEAYWSQVPCVTLRDETEWVETVESGWNVLAGADYGRIIEAVDAFKIPMDYPPLYGDGHAAEKIINIILERYLINHE